MQILISKENRVVNAARELDNESQKIILWSTGVRVETP